VEILKKFAVRSSQFAVRFAVACLQFSKTPRRRSANRER
jgi:hypothetical protein